MEARQRVKLSLTNRSIGLISSFAERQIDPSTSLAAGPPRAAATAKLTEDTPHTIFLVFAGLVAIARGKTPDPIPNSAVKTLRANGTAS